MKRYLAVAQWVFTAIVAVAIVWVLVDRWQEIPTDLEVAPWPLAAISIATIASFYFNGASLSVLARRFGAEISVVETALLGTAASTLNYLPMKSGTLVNGVLMRGRYGVRFAHFAALVAGNTLIYLWVTATVAGVLLMAEYPGDLIVLGLAVVPTVCLVGLTVWGRYQSKIQQRESASKWWRKIAQAVEGLALIGSDVRLLGSVAFINSILVLLQAVRFYYAFDALGAGIGIADSLVVAAIGVVTQRIAILPGGLGTREGGVAGGAAMVGLSSTVGLAAAVVDRAVLLVWLLLLGLPVTLFMLRKNATVIGAQVEAETPTEGP